DREVLAGKVDEPAIDRRGPGNDAVGRDFLAGHAEVDLPVLGEQAELLEAAGIDQGVDALAGGELALLPLLCQAVGPAALLEVFSLAAQVLDQLLHRLSRIGGHGLPFLSETPSPPKQGREGPECLLTRARRSPCGTCRRSGPDR